MDLREIYYRIRPLAKLRADQRKALWAHESSKEPLHPLLGFLLGFFCSIAGGLFFGILIWLSLGFSPENSGGTFIFLGGSIAMSTISAVTFLLRKHRGVFYGLNGFTAFTLIGLISNQLAGKSTWKFRSSSRYLARVA